MDCSCGGDTSILSTRRGKGIVRRRRECLLCGSRFTTYERIMEKVVAVAHKQPQAAPSKKVVPTKATPRKKRSWADSLVWMGEDEDFLRD